MPASLTVLLLFSGCKAITHIRVKKSSKLENIPKDPAIENTIS